VDEQLDQARRKVLASITELRFLGKKYGEVFSRRCRDQDKQSTRNRGRFTRFVCESRIVHWPYTPWARGGAVQVLAGDFDRAVALVKKMKTVATPYQRPTFMDRDVRSQTQLYAQELDQYIVNKRATVSLGELLKAKLGLA
jgi:hypothetical protein